MQRWMLGIDVGSTTVKAVVVDPDSRKVLWKDYQRHQTKQPETVIAFLERISTEFDLEGARVFVTGSGASPLVEPLGAKFVQEVNAVTYAVEHLYPDAGSVVELGGQDAKIIVFKSAANGDKQAIPSMNDKCASGTGATIDKCMIKVGLPIEDATKLHFDGSKLHHVAAKCGVFAETDIVNLIKAGIPAHEVLCSLADAIVMQNLSVLTRGNTLRSKVILLGGPNTYLPFLQECWRERIPQTWRERGYAYPQDVPIEELIVVPTDSQYFAALGAVLHGLADTASGGHYRGLDPLREFVRAGRKARLSEAAGPPLVADQGELAAFQSAYAIPKFETKVPEKDSIVRAVIGLDGGSTSSKAVLVDENYEIVAKAYQLSKGNPIADMQDLLASLRDQINQQGATLEILGFGATGYAGDVLEEVLEADVNVVETVAHAMSATHFFSNVDVVCDIGGQDIKVLMLKHGEISGFRLSNQCSAGNGMLLQAMADQFGVPIRSYADVAFAAELAPKFSYGCAVFLDTDRVNFQKEGYSKEELLAGLAQVLPKNVWQYVAQVPRLAALGKRFVLQGGTQYNLAAVKAQVDYIKQRVPDAEVFVHPHTGEAGALGAAFEALRVVNRRGYSKFVGLDAALQLTYSARTDDSTTCHFCPNECKRTFIDARRPDGSSARIIAGFSCEKGTVESNEAMMALANERKKLARAYPNTLQYEAYRAFAHTKIAMPMPEASTPINDVEVKSVWWGLGQKRVPIQRAFERSSPESAQRRKRLRIGMPRVLNMYSTAPFFRAYFEALGIAKHNIVFSDETSEEMWSEGGKYGSIDPCFPAKVVQAHIHNLLFKHHTEKTPLSMIFFPCLTHVPSFLEATVDNAACPVVAGTPNVMRAAFTKEKDYFAERSIRYVDPSLSFIEPVRLARQMFEHVGTFLEVTEDENDHACKVGWRAMELYSDDLQEKGRAILETVEAENRVAILVLCRPYHADPGLHHAIPDEYQVLGYPILSIKSIPRDPVFLSRFFAPNEKPLEINDVWPENYSANSAMRVWGAKFAARHPNVVVLDLSSFKCGHDAPTYGLLDAILGASQTPYSALHDIDANKPGGSIKIRVKTFAHSLSLHEERLVDLAGKKRELELTIAQKKLSLLEAKRDQAEQAHLANDALEQEIASLRAKITTYQPAPRRSDIRDLGLVTLRRKSAEPRAASGLDEAAE